jgi:serine/threonine-protein kinase
VPSVIGLLPGSAETKLISAGFGRGNISVRYDCYGSANGDTSVHAQSVGAGRVVPLSSSITITATSSSCVYLPNEVGQSYGTAYDDLKSRGFVPASDCNYGAYATSPVTAQSPAGGVWLMTGGIRVTLTSLCIPG